MKKIFATPEVRVIALDPNDVIATSPTVLSVGDDVLDGDNVTCDAPGRLFNNWDVY